MPGTALQNPDALVGRLLATSGGQYGGLGWVDSVQQLNDLVLLHVRSAPLREAVMTGNVAQVFDLAAPNPTFINFSGELVNLAGLEVANDGLAHVTLPAASLELTGSFQFDFETVDFSVTRVDFDVTSMRVAANIDVEMDFVDQAYAGVSQTIGVLNKRYVFTAGGFLPVVVVAQVKVDLQVSVTPSGRLALRIGGMRADTFDAGVSWNDVDGWSTRFAHLGTERMTRPPMAPPPLGLGMNAAFKPSVSMMLYGLAGPSLALNAGIRGEIPTADPACGFEFTGYAKADVVGEVTFLDDVIPPLSATLLDVVGPTIYAPPQTSYYQAQCCGTLIAPRDFRVTHANRHMFGCEILHGTLEVMAGSSAPPPAGTPREALDLSFLREIHSASTALRVFDGQLAYPTDVNLSGLEFLDAPNSTVHGGSKFPMVVDLGSLTRGALHLSVIAGAGTAAGYGVDWFVPEVRFGASPFAGTLSVEVSGDPVSYQLSLAPAGTPDLFVFVTGGSTLDLPAVTAAQRVQLAAADGSTVRLGLTSVAALFADAQGPSTLGFPSLVSAQCVEASVSAGAFLNLGALTTVLDAGAVACQPLLGGALHVTSNQLPSEPSPAVALIALQQVGGELRVENSSGPIALAAPSLQQAGDVTLFGGLPALVLPALTSVTGSFNVDGADLAPSVAALSLPALTRADLTVGRLPDLTQLNLPVLATGSVTAGNCAALQEVLVPVATNLASLNVTSTSLVTANAPLLAVANTIRLESPVLATVSLPALQSVGSAPGSLTIGGSSLTNAQLPALTQGDVVILGSNAFTTSGLNVCALQAGSRLAVSAGTAFSSCWTTCFGVVRGVATSCIGCGVAGMCPANQCPAEVAATCP